MDTRIKRYDPVVYPRKLWIAIGNLEEVLDKFSSCDGKPLQVPNDITKNTIFGITYGFIMDNDDNHGVLIWFANKSNISKYIHEAVHAANRVFNDLGISFNLDDDEHYAYFVQWIVECIRDFFNCED